MIKNARRRNVDAHFNVRKKTVRCGPWDVLYSVGRFKMHFLILLLGLPSRTRVRYLRRFAVYVTAYFR